MKLVDQPAVLEWPETTNRKASFTVQLASPSGHSPNGLVLRCSGFAIRSSPREATALRPRRIGTCDRSFA
jgi:hypothetical protein